MADTYQLSFTAEEIDNMLANIGDIDAALDAILAIQNELIGGDGA